MAKRAMEQAQHLVEEGLLKEAVHEPIPMDEVKRANEMHVYGTTLILLVIEPDGVAVGNGMPGLVARRLYEQMRTEMLPQSEWLTRVFE